MAEKKQRMAGEALRDQHFAARERKSNDPEQAAERASRVGDNFDVSGYSDKEISMALQGDTFDKNDYARLTGEKIGGDEPQVEEPSKEPTVSIPTPTPSPSPSPLPAPEKPSRPGLRPIVLPQMGDGSQTQVVNQDNDVNTNVTGNENVTNINQDNSVRQYGAYGSAADRSKALRDKYVADISKFTTA